MHGGLVAWPCSISLEDHAYKIKRYSAFVAQEASVSSVLTYPSVSSHLLVSSVLSLSLHHAIRPCVVSVCSVYVR